MPFVKVREYGMTIFSSGIIHEIIYQTRDRSLIYFQYFLDDGRLFAACGKVKVGWE